MCIRDRDNSARSVATRSCWGHPTQRTRASDRFVRDSDLLVGCLFLTDVAQVLGDVQTPLPFSENNLVAVREEVGVGYDGSRNGPGQCQRSDDQAEQHTDDIEPRGVHRTHRPVFLRESTANTSLATTAIPKSSTPTLRLLAAWPASQLAPTTPPESRFFSGSGPHTSCTLGALFRPDVKHGRFRRPIRGGIPARIAPRSCHAHGAREPPGGRSGGPLEAHRARVNTSLRASRAAFIVWPRIRDLRPVGLGRTSCTLVRRFRPDATIPRAQHT